MRPDIEKRLRRRVIVPADQVRDRRRSARGKLGALPLNEWPEADRLGWMEALRPAQRFKRGGAASNLAPVSQADIANRYGLYLNYLQRNGRLDPKGNAVTLVTLDDVHGFVAELQSRVRSVTVWNSVYKLRRASQLIAPSADFGWLTEIEKDVALIMMPRSKVDRVVLTERLVDAGLTLIREAEMFGKNPLARATGVRNGLLIVLLALHPIRIKNFAALRIANTFIKIGDRWWLHVPSDNTKSHRMDERQVPEFITDVVNRYIEMHRPVLCRGVEHSALWVSSTTGRQLTTKNLGSLISKITRETIGVDVSPHLFRTAGASTAALYGNSHPHLATALLNHRDVRITEDHYNLSTSLAAGAEYAVITQSYREHDS
jgi:integrase